MTLSPAPRPGRSADTDRRLAYLQDLGEQIPRFARLVHAFKAQQAAENRDHAALILLYPLVRLGPLRQGALAESVHIDPSTVSRHVTSLVERGLVTRVADETDGRASRLVVTDAGHAAFDQLRQDRESHLRQITAGWTEADLATFTTLFARLMDDLAAGLPNDPHCPAGPASAPRTTAPGTTSPREKR